MPKIVSTLIVSFVLAACSSAFAEVHVINDAVVREHGGFPYKITEPGTYRLDGNLTLTRDTDAIVVNADHVNINLNGFSIAGPLVCTLADETKGVSCPTGGKGVGIRSGSLTSELSGHRDIKVFNGSIHGMGSHGVFLTGDGSLVEKVSADFNGGIGLFVAGLVTASSGNANGQNGIFADTVRDSSALNNTSDGMVIDARGGISTGNIATFNGGNGMNLPNGTAIGNTIVRNGLFGIVTRCPAVISSNSIINNTGGSIDIQQGNDCAIVNNSTLP
jgi:hypothetical protein